jgi:hypothetical protein
LQRCEALALHLRPQREPDPENSRSHSNGGMQFECLLRTLLRSTGLPLQSSYNPNYQSNHD